MTATSEGVEYLVMISCIGIATDPTKLELAIVAGHVIATLTLLNISLAKRTNAHFLIFYPFFKLNIQLPVTGRKETTMIYSATLEANVLST